MGHAESNDAAGDTRERREIIPIPTFCRAYRDEVDEAADILAVSSDEQNDSESAPPDKRELDELMVQQG